VDGIKTGFIHASGFNLAASMVRGNHRIIAVVMGGESVKARDNKMAKLLEATHSNLTGKKYPSQKKNPCSIGDLICALSPSQARATPIKAKLHKAVIRNQCRPAKLMKTKYSPPATSLDDFLDDLDKDKAHKSSPKKKSQKSLHLVQKSKIVKKRPNLLLKSKVRKIEPKKPVGRKTSKKSKRNK
jgi:D-alanyl-D-alanine carboxypeptidase